MSNSDEVVLPFAAPVAELGKTTHVSSTLLASSMQSLRAKNLYERYVTLLPAAYRDQVLTTVVGEWLPIECGRAHYGACDALGLTVAEQTAMGYDVHRRVHETFLGLVVRMAKGVGVTPWVVLARSNTLYQKLWRGGGTQIVKHGPKDATIEVVGVTLIDIPYFRNAMLGMYEAAVRLFATRVHLRSVPVAPHGTIPRIVMRVQWI